MPEAVPTAPRARYDGLDLFRPLSIFGVVLIHFSLGWRFPSTPAFDVLLRARDCAFPIILMTSFFVLTRTVVAHSDRSFGLFAAGRFRRLVVPCLIWSGLYWLMWEVVGPLWSVGHASWPPPTLVLSGFSHLWFLQFLFAGSVIAYPAIRAVARRPRLTWGAAAACVAAAVAYWAWGRPLLSAHVRCDWVDQANPSLRVALIQSVTYAQYTVLGVAVGLVADVINTAYRRRAFRAATLVLAAAAFVVHVSSAAPVVSRAVYTVAVFVVLLRPWPPGILDWLRPAARCSYPVYIIHPAMAQVVLLAFACWQVGPSLPGLLAGSIGVFALSGAAAALLRMLVPADWFLPLVAVGKRRPGAEMR